MKPGDVAEAIPVADGRVQNIHVSEVPEEGSQAMTRVEIGLSAPVDHKVTAGPEGVKIALTPAGSETTAQAGDPWAAPQGEEDAQAEEPEAGAWTGEPAEGELAADTHPATMLTGVDAHRVGAGSLIHLKGDGSVDNAVSFSSGRRGS